MNIQPPLMKTRKVTGDANSNGNLSDISVQTLASSNLPKFVPVIPPRRKVERPAIAVDSAQTQSQPRSVKSRQHNGKYSSNTLTSHRDSFYAKSLEPLPVQIQTPLPRKAEVHVDIKTNERRKEHAPANNRKIEHNLPVPLYSENTLVENSEIVSLEQLFSSLKKPSWSVLQFPTNLPRFCKIAKLQVHKSGRTRLLFQDNQPNSDIPSYPVTYNIDLGTGTQFPQQIAMINPSRDPTSSLPSFSLLGEPIARLRARPLISPLFPETSNPEIL
jgi:hypothetical protein